MKRIPIASVRGVIVIALIWLAIAAYALVEMWPDHPRTVGGWILFITLAPLAMFLLEAIMGWVWKTRPARYISEHPSQSVRVVLGVLAFGLLMAAIAAIWFAVEHWSGIAFT